VQTPEEFERRRQKMRDGDVLGVIRENPVLYTGESTLTALYHFLGGYETAKYVHQIPPRHVLPKDFHDWVAYRLHFRESTSGYRRMILQHFPDESKALDQFFSLFDEHRTRQERVIATVRCHPSNPKIMRWEGGDPKNKRQVRVAEEIKLVVYTDDPGFFVVHDDIAAEYPETSSFCYALCWLHHPFRPDSEYTTVLDQGQYDRLCRENLIFAQQDKERAERAKLRFEQKKVN
jgi:hypothetical protein